MSCFFHLDEEDVVKCAKCKIGLCRTCDENAFLRTENGTGQVVCIRCSQIETQALVAFGKAFLKKRLIKVIFSAIFVALGIFSFIAYGKEGLYATFLCWFISGVIVILGLKKDKEFSKSDFRRELFRYEHPVAYAMSIIFL